VNKATNNIFLMNTITFDRCNAIQMNRADWGGFAYFDNNQISLRILNSEVRNHTAYKRSAFLETPNMNKLDIYWSELVGTYAPETAAMHSTARTLNMKMYKS
jgi:hypothetical protein